MSKPKPKPKPQRKADPLTPIFNATVAELPSGWLRSYLEQR